jgi:hypothetical protein
MISDSLQPSAFDPKLSRRALLSVFGAVILGRAGTELRSLDSSTWLLSSGSESETKPSAEPVAEIPLPALFAGTLAAFVPLVGSRFNLSNFKGSQPVTLIEASATHVATLGQQPASGEAFLLLFEGVAGNPLSEGSYRLRHSELPNSSYFVSPVGQGLRSQHYQVVIDQRVFEPMDGKTVGMIPKEGG